MAITTRISTGIDRPGDLEQRVMGRLRRNRVGLLVEAPGDVDQQRQHEDRDGEDDDVQPVVEPVDVGGDLGHRVLQVQLPGRRHAGPGQRVARDQRGGGGCDGRAGQGCNGLAGKVPACKVPAQKSHGSDIAPHRDARGPLSAVLAKREGTSPARPCPTLRHCDKSKITLAPVGQCEALRQAVRHNRARREGPARCPTSGPGPATGPPNRSLLDRAGPAWSQHRRDLTSRPGRPGGCRRSA